MNCLISSLFFAVLLSSGRRSQAEIYNTTVDGCMYYVSVNNSRSFSESLLACHKLHATVVFLKTDQKANDLKSVLYKNVGFSAKEREYWIGARKQVSSGEFLWGDGTKMQRAKERDWLNITVSNTTQGNCFYTIEYQGWTLQSGNCNTTKEYICSKCDAQLLPLRQQDIIVIAVTSCVTAISILSVIVIFAIKSARASTSKGPSTPAVGNTDVSELSERRSAPRRQPSARGWSFASDDEFSDCEE